MESTAPYRSLQHGEMLNWYRVERILGRGGFGVIYLATDTNLDLLVAIKEYIPSDIARRDPNDSKVLPITREHDGIYRWGLERFIKEARNLVRFKHPNIVRVMSVFQENNTAYMVMEFEEGEDLRRYFKHEEHCGEDCLRDLILPITDGLAEVHRHGFIHRDIKPANILVRKDGSPVLLDFGSARNASKFNKEGLTALVSVGYAPFEQYTNDNDEQQGPWTDIYALAGIMYFAISGSDPVDSTQRGAALFNGGRDPLIPASLVGKDRYSPAFLNAVDWALEFRIADRPQSLVDWRPALLAEDMPDTSTRVYPGAGIDLPFEHVAALQPAADDQTRISSRRADSRPPAHGTESRRHTGRQRRRATDLPEGRPAIAAPVSRRASDRARGATHRSTRRALRSPGSPWLVAGRSSSMRSATAA